MDSLGNPVRLLVSAGEKADITQAESLLKGLRAEHVLADKAYDSDALIKKIESSQARAVIPPRSNRKQQRSYDKELYKERNKVERFFNKIKQFRRVATRYEKTARNYLAMAIFASIVILLA